MQAKCTTATKSRVLEAGEGFRTSGYILKIEMRRGVVTTYTNRKKKCSRNISLCYLPVFKLIENMYFIYSNLLIFPDILSRIDENPRFRVVGNNA